MQETKDERTWVTLGELCEDRGISYRTATRWCKNGVLGVRLQTRSLGYRVVTTPEWLEEFDERIQSVRENRGKDVVERTRKPRRSAAAERVRARHGL